MVCPRCGGDGAYKNKDAPGALWSCLPCPECQGSGIVSCCDTAGAMHSVTAEESKILRAAILASSEVIEAKDFGNAYENIGKKR